MTTTPILKRQKILGLFRQFSIHPYGTPTEKATLRVIARSLKSTKKLKGLQNIAGNKESSEPCLLV